jgi:hypothetical protein
MRMKRIATLATALAALAFVAPLAAHHSMGMFDVATPLWVKGTVLRYQPISPHAMIELEARQQDGQVQRWTIEGPFPGRLHRIMSFHGVADDAPFFRPGDTIEVCGFALKTHYTAGRMYPDAEHPGNRFMHGHVVVMPDGHMQFWGPYGKIENCVRPSDTPASWAEFLNVDPLAREFWCNTHAVANVAAVRSQAFADEIANAMKQPCE